MAKYRPSRVANEIMREVQAIISRKVRDPRVQNVTITSVSMTGDLSLASIYYSILDDSVEAQKTVQQGLEKATGIIKRELGKNLTMYKTPDLVFALDQSIQYGAKIDSLLRQLHQQD